VSAGVICDNPMTDSGAKANRSEVMSASAHGLYLFMADRRRALQTRDVSACRIRRTEYSGGRGLETEHGRASEAPPTERGGQRLCPAYPTAPDLDSTR
jgi:hypothetical protein